MNPTTGRGNAPYTSCTSSYVESVFPVSDIMSSTVSDKLSAQSVVERDGSLLITCSLTRSYRFVANHSFNLVDLLMSSEHLATYNTTSAVTYHRGGAITVHGLSLVHDGGRVLFNPADFSIKHGSVTGLVGTNGSGKVSVVSRPGTGAPYCDLIFICLVVLLPVLK
mmetsp:Transcript_6378/g.12309  ORF Transcript_6378/g.12309 Transcript_6378/m.12309 type:complete len:166 (-) Transcript_6378:1011-1508(-)